MNIPWGRILIFTVCLYLFFIFLAWAYASRVMFPAPSPTYEKSESIKLLQTPSGNKIALARHGNLENPKISILYSHGNAEDLGGLESFFEKWKDKDWEFIAYDYPGYGLSTGTPSEESCYESMDLVYQYLLNELGRPPERILIWGRSLGTGPSCYLASKQKAAGIILETPFTSAFRTVTEIPLLPWDYFNNLEHTKSITCPSLIIHGEWDEVVPFRHGKRLHHQLPEPKEFLEIKEATHNNLEQVGGKNYHDTIIRFVDNLAS